MSLSDTPHSQSMNGDSNGQDSTGIAHLPDPWLFDSEALLRELARCRETALQIPVTNPNATHFGVQLTVNAIYNLEENLRYLLHLHREGSGRKGHFLAAKFAVARTRTKTIYLYIDNERRMTWPGEGLLIKLWETLAEKGIGGLLTPWHIKREALAHTQARQIELVGLADAEREADEIRSGRLKLSDSHYALALPSPKSRETKEPKTIVEPHRAVEVATTAIVADALRREVNVAKAITYAESTLKDDEQKPPDRNVDTDWLYRWRDAAGAVSSEDLQSIWGRLLAGELKSPGSYSYRTLDFVRNLTTDEAKNIEHVSQFVIDDFVSRKQQNLLDENQVSFGYLLGLQNLGLLSEVDGLGLGVTINSTHEDRFFKLFRSHGRALKVTHDDPTKKLKLEAYTLTSLGKQVLRLGKFQPNEQYLRAIGEELKGQGMAVTIGSYQTVSENSVRFFDEQPL